MTITSVDGAFSIWRLNPQSEIPEGLLRSGSFISVTKTVEEISIVCESGAPVSGLGCKEESGWRLLKVEGPLDFSITGLLASMSGALARESVSVFAISTYDTDYLLVRDAALQAAKSALSAAGFCVT
jgi:hypothetical protein